MIDPEREEQKREALQKIMDKWAEAYDRKQAERAAAWKAYQEKKAEQQKIREVFENGK